MAHLERVRLRYRVDARPLPTARYTADMIFPRARVGVFIASGIGGFAMATAPAIVTFVGGTPQEALNATLEMYEITTAESKYFSMPALDFRGTPTGIDIRKVVSSQITPVVDTSIAHKQPGHGTLGSGLSRAPLACFTQAMERFREKYGMLRRQSRREHYQPPPLLQEQASACGLARVVEPRLEVRPAA